MKLIKLSKPDCVPCSNVSNYLKDNNVEYTEINIYEHREVIAKYNLTGAPVTLLVDENDKEIERVSGFNPPLLDILISKCQ